MNKLVLISFFLIAELGFGQSSSHEHPQKLFLKLGYLSEVRIPEPYLKVKPSVPIIEIDNIEGLNKQVITVQPVTDKKGETNLRIYTKRYAFNVKVIINESGKEPTQMLDLGANIQDFERLQASKVEDNRNGKSSDGKGGVVTNDIVVSSDASDFIMTSLLNVKEDLLRPNPYCYSIRKSRVTFAVDHIFYHKDKIVFKMSLYNRSNVPYGVADLTIKYKERRGIKFINRRETKSIVLQSYYEEYNNREIAGGGVGHLIYVVEKIGTQDNGRFNFVLREENGNRNFNFEVPSYIN